MNHQIIDAINKAYDDEVSRLFAELCRSPVEDARQAVGRFGAGVKVARSAREAALAEMRRSDMQPESAA